MSKPAGEGVLDLVQALIESRPFAVGTVARMTGALLDRNPSESNEYFDIYASGPRPSGPFMDVELRIPVERRTANDGLVVLNVRPTSQVSRGEVMQRFGKNPEIRIPTPRQPPDAPVYLVYDNPWGQARFGFGRDDQLKTIVVDATEA